jgi:hypothetical protein
VESLSALSVQAKLSDVSIDSLQGGLAKLARNAADAASGSKQQAAAFQAMGVSLKDTNGNLRSTQDILADVSAKFAGYADSASKTALAQQLFGKSGADLIPLLNQLGTEGFAAVRAEAEKYGAVISGDAAKASEQFNDNLTKLKLETEGFANSVVQQLLPGLNKLSDEMVKAGETTDAYAGSATTVANAVKGLVLGLITVKEFLSGAATVTFAFYDAVKTSFGAAADYVGVWAAGVYKEIKAAFTFGGPGVGDIQKQTAAQLDAISGSAKSAFEGIRSALGTGLHDNITNVKTAFNDLFGTFANVSSGATTTASALHKIPAPLVASADASDKAAKALEDYNKAQQKAAQFLAQIAGNLTPVNKAYSEYVAGIIQVNKISDDMISTSAKAGKAQEGFAQAQEFAAQATVGLNRVLDENLDKIARQADVLGRIQKEYADQAALIGLTDRQRAIAEAVQKATDEWTKNAEAMIANKQSLDEVQAGAAAAAGSVFDLTEKAKASREVADQFASIWKSAGDSIADAFSKWVVEGGSFMKSLVDVAKQVVEQIISYFAKLAVINPILNALFGGGGAGGGGFLPTLASIGGSVIGGGSSSGAFDWTGAGADSTGGMFGTAQGGLSLFNAGKTMWGGFQTGLDNLYASGGIGSSFLGTTTYGDFGNTFAPSGFTYGAAALGGAYAGYNRYQNSQGGAAGIAGGVAYGVGTYTAGIAGAAAISGGVSAGLAAIGPIGWVALAAMLIDMMSGGKLFGTKGKFNFGESAISIDSMGATVTAGYDLKGQKPLFGGSTHSWQTIAADPAAQAAADAFFKQLENGTAAFAKQFGVTMGDVVGGQFIATFDKKGNITKTQSTVLGKTYSEDQAHFTERLSAENMLAVLGQFDKGLSAAVDQFRADADQLMAVTSALAQGESMIQAGTTFLALGTDQSLSALLKLAEASQQFGESIDQTLQRIEQAQAQYDQFVGQFKPPTNYVDDFEATLAGIEQQMQANIKQANALAIAAGAAGASEKDLANIHAYAAHQAAEAIKALEASAQSLAFGLGLTTQGSLSDVNSEIQALQAKAGQGASALHGFSSALSAVADAAKAKMDLLLGDLSPFNDQEKWQTALQGLRAGTATVDQALQIARRLFGTGADYTAAFNQAMAFNRGGAATGGTGGGVSGGGLTGAEQQRLSDLLKEQQTLQAAATRQQYQTLAQQVAEIASAKGEDWRTVLSKMDVNIADFEKGLGLNDQQTQDLIDNIQKQVDDNGENTSSIVDILTKIYNVLSGNPDGSTGPRGHSQHGSSPLDPDPRGGRGHGGHGFVTPNQRGTRESTNVSRIR